MPITPVKIIKKLPRYGKDLITIIGCWIQSLFFKDKDKYRNAWLICERGIEAKDNGYTFFKYMREQHPERKVFYLIDPSQTDDYNRVKPLGNIIPYNSHEHRMALFFASHLISTHIGFITPWSTLLFKTFFRQSCTFVLLNHGITKEDMSDMLNKKTTGVDLFIAATRQEWETVALDKRYGYRQEDVALTGYARYDNWHNFKTRQQIVFMPTWRYYLVTRRIDDKNHPLLKENFMQSAYFRHINSLLNNTRLHTFLEKHHTQLIFYPHYEMQSGLPCFSCASPHVIFADKRTHNLPDLLKESLAMITDYSGVGFDFAYMHKPLVYYQFDQDEYYSKHYIKGNFDMEQNGLGEVVKTEQELLDLLEEWFANHFQLSEKYEARINSFFTFHDNRNCERIYHAIIAYKKQ